MVSNCYWKPDCPYPSEECNPKCNSYSPTGSTPSDLCDTCARWDNETDTCKSIEMCDYLEKDTKIVSKENLEAVRRNTDAIANSQDCKQDAHKPQLSLVPMQIVYDIAKVREKAVDGKYKDPDNWKQVEPYRIVNALLRHALALASDWKSIDEESGLPHLYHLETNAAFLSAFMEDDNEP